MRRFAYFALVALLGTGPIVGGCGSASSELTGSVQYKGKPVVVGTVTVYDAQQNAYQGVIEGGQYSIAGIPPGSIQLVVLSRDPKGAPPPKLPDGSNRKGGRDSREKKGDGAPIVGWFPLPKKYEERETSPLKTEIKTGPNTYDIKLD